MPFADGADWVADARSFGYCFEKLCYKNELVSRLCLNRVAGNSFYDVAGILGKSLAALTGLKMLNISGLRECSTIGQSLTALTGLQSFVYSGERRCMVCLHSNVNSHATIRGCGL